MKKFRFKILMLISALGIVSSISARAQFFSYGPYLYFDIISETDRTVSVERPTSYYGVSDNEINRYKKYADPKEIPRKVIYNSKSYTVIEIGPYAFQSCESVTSMNIPNSVTTIGDYAFEDCKYLTSVNIPNSVTTIGDYAFNNCESLTSVDIPNSVTTIGNRAFRSCESLTSVHIGNSVTTIGDYAFEYCKDLTSVDIPNSVTTIGDYAFSLCWGLTSVDIPNSVTTIGDNAFFQCWRLTSVDIPNSVTRIGSEPFRSCYKLLTINVQNDNPVYVSIDGILYAKKNGIPNYLLQCPCAKSGVVAIPNSVTTIWDRAFEGCQYLTSVDIPNSVTTIGDYAFDAFRIYCHWDNPKEMNTKLYNNCLEKAILYVPIGTKAKYEKVDPWRNFWNIEEFDYESVSGINDIEDSNGNNREEVMRSDVSGKQVSKDYKGLVIIHYSDGSTLKSIIK